MTGITEEYACPLTGDRPPVPCESCRGSGRRTRIIHGDGGDGRPALFTVTEPCPDCRCTGKRGAAS